MLHQQFQRILPEADTAFLCIHGILGTPDHFDFLIPLIPDSVSIYNLLLDGHGKSAADFSHTSMKTWEMQVNQTICELLKSHEHLYIVAHSMGTLFAIEQAIQCRKVRGLFLLAVPIIVSPKALMFQNSAKVFLGNIREDDRFGKAAQASCSVVTSANPLHYTGWIIRYLELFRKISQTKRRLADLRTPSVAIQSRLDEMVGKNADEYLRIHSSMSVYTLEKSYHYLYDPTDLQFIKSQFQQFITFTKGGKQ